MGFMLTPVSPSVGFTPEVPACSAIGVVLLPAGLQNARRVPSAFATQAFVSATYSPETRTSVVLTNQAARKRRAVGAVILRAVRAALGSSWPGDESQAASVPAQPCVIGT